MLGMTIFGIVILKWPFRICAELVLFKAHYIVAPPNQIFTRPILARQS